MNNLTIETEDTFASLLELAANNDVEGFKRFIELEFSGINEIGLWYGREKGSKSMILLHRTPLMVACTYGSIDIVKLILSSSDSDLDINKPCGLDKSTALHCAASSGSSNAIDVIKLLLSSGADPNSIDSNGNCPIHVIVVHPKSSRASLEELLSTDSINLRVSISNSNSNSPPLSPENGSLYSNSSPDSSKIINVSEKKEYPIDPSLPDIKNGIYSTDEFRMFSFKVRPCSRAYSHDWTECPFVHPGENARRRDPRKYHYSCVPCPDFRKGACRRGDMCEYAHGVFESWLHPAQYRTRICKDGTSCNRRVCFFAHTQEELRPLYVSTGSGVPSPRSGSPTPFTPPISPSANGISNMVWPRENVPVLHLPNSNFGSSRLRSSLNARDIQTEEFDCLPDFDIQQQHLLNELSRLSQPSLGNMNMNRVSANLTPSNLDDIFSAESSSSPRYSPTHKSAIFNQFQQQQKSMLSPIKTSSFSPKSIDHPLLQAGFSPKSIDHSLLNSPFGTRSPRGGMDPISPMSSRVSMLAREKQQQMSFRSLSSRDLGTRSNSLVGENSWSNWGSSSSNNTKADWTVNADEFGKLRRSSSFEMKNNTGEEPDLSWVHSLVKESPADSNENRPKLPVSEGVVGSSLEDSKMNYPLDPIDQSILGAWLEQMQIDQLTA